MAYVAWPKNATALSSDPFKIMIDEKVVIITGASQGIGAGLASAFRDAGYKVIANSRSIGASTKPNVVKKPCTEYTDEDYASMLATNLTGFFHLTQRSVRLMERQGWGHIVNVTTTQAEQPIKGAPALLASLTKGGLDAFIRMNHMPGLHRCIRSDGSATCATWYRP